MTNPANELLDSNRRIYIVATGAGAGLQKMLWDVPGISKVLVGAEFPYAPEATNRFLGFRPEEGYCSESAAIALAMEAYYRAFQPLAPPAVGLGLTASVASNAEHRGDHRVYVATVTDTECWVHRGILVKGHGPDARSRDGDISDRFGLSVLLQATGQKVTLRTAQEDPLQIGYSLLGHESRECNEDAMNVLLGHPLFTASGKRLPFLPNSPGLTLFPGAFNPPHDAHLWMAKETQAVFHITINPPHKSALGVAEVLQRARFLEGSNRLFTKDDPLYIDKARRFPGSKMLIGADALERMLDPKWGLEVGAMFDEFSKLGVKFLVVDREVDGKLVTLDTISGAPKALCARLVNPVQHLGMSSTKIREAVGSFA